jgi:hypothetical protein
MSSYNFDTSSPNIGFVKHEILEKPLNHYLKSDGEYCLISFRLAISVPHQLVCTYANLIRISETHEYIGNHLVCIVSLDYYLQFHRDNSIDLIFHE